MKDKKLRLIIEAAIRKEEEAYAFYRDLSGRVDGRTTRDTLQFIAGEEKKHREFLIRYRDGHYSAHGLPLSQAVDYKIAEHLEKPDIKKNMETQEVYLVAAHRELSSHEFYKTLAEQQPEGEVRDMLLSMAQEELRHKEKMEYLYANTAFPQTAGG